LRAQIVVWVAKTFREEHLSAVSWLNENTVDPFAFFAVRLRLVEIGDSRLAPVFEVVARPNNWDRQIQSFVAEETNPQTERQRRFWSFFQARFPDTRGELHGGKGTTRWRLVEDLGLVVARWIGLNSVGVFIRGQRGTAYGDWASTMGPWIETLQSRLGAEYGRDGEPFAKPHLIDMTDEKNWAAAADWLHCETERYVSVLQEVVGAPT
jgi:hypothetical protein